MHFSFTDKEQKEIYLSTQSFSSIDLDRDEKESGIVYPYDYKEKIENGITTSSIIDLHNTDDRLIKHTETRLCNTIDADRIEYQKLETISMVIDEENKKSLANRLLFGILDKQDSLKGYIESQDKINITDELLEIIKEYKNFEHSYTLIDSKHVSEKKFEYYPSVYGKYGEGTLFSNEIVKEQSISDGFELDDLDDFLISDDTPKHIEKEFEKLDNIFDFSNVTMSELRDFHDYFKENRNKVCSGLLESLIMDFYGYDCTNKKIVEQFRKDFKFNIDRQTLSNLTNYTLEKLKKYEETINEISKSTML